MRFVRVGIGAMGAFAAFAALGALGVEVGCSSFEPQIVADDAAVADALTERADTPFDASTEADAGFDEQYRYVFVSSERRVGTFRVDGGVVLGARAADVWCKALADRSEIMALRGRSWAAWLSTMQEEARSRIGAVDGKLSNEFRAVNGDTVIFPRNFIFQIGSEGGAVLPMDLIRLNQNGRNDGPLSVWTGTNSLGKQHGENCDDWTYDEPARKGAVGANNVPDWWTVSATVTSACDQRHHVYCFEKR